MHAHARAHAPAFTAPPSRLTPFHNRQELSGELGAHLLKASISVERALRITYLPQAVRAPASAHMHAACGPENHALRRRPGAALGPPAPGSRWQAAAAACSGRAGSRGAASPHACSPPCAGSTPSPRPLHSTHPLGPDTTPHPATHPRPPHSRSRQVFRVRPVARCTASMPGHSEAVLSVHFSPDGKRLASGSGDTTVRLWDLNTQLPQCECKVGPGGGALGVWGSLACCEGLHTCTAMPEPNAFAARTPSPCPGPRLPGATAAGCCWSRGPPTHGCPARRAERLESPQPPAPQGHRSWVLVVAWSPDAKCIASGDMDGTILLWDPSDGKLLGSCSGHKKWITSLVSGPWG